MPIVEDELDACLLRYSQRKRELQDGGSLAACIAGIGEWHFCPRQALDVDCIYLVDSAVQLRLCSETLQASRVVGVDIERHWLHSFSGYTCLLQLSTACNGGM
eukprot:4041893-Amphidinium_carterae.1